MVENQGQDASRLSFPLPLVWTIVAAAITICGSVLGTSWSQRADIREILVKISYQEERNGALSRQMEMMRLDIENMKLQLARAAKD